VKVKVDKTVMASVALHVIVLGWVMLSFSTKALEIPPDNSIGVELSLEGQAMAGVKTAKPENKKPRVDKIAEAKPIDDAVGKITEKAPILTETAPPPPSKAEEKPVEKKPDPPKADPSADEIKKAEAEALAIAKAEAEAKAAEAKAKAEKAKAKAEADARAKAAKAKAEADAKAKAEADAKAKAAEYKFDPAKIQRDLQDKRDPTRMAAGGDRLNPNDAYGQTNGKSADNSATWGAMFRQQVERCWKKPYGGIEQQKSEAVFAISLKRDGSLEGAPRPLGTPSSPYVRVYQESALRAIIECQPYKLPGALFEEWKSFEPVFTERKM
jgi:colicin import membrane protein